MKNLAKHKVAVRTREYIVQAIFQLLFNNESVDSIIKQFEDEHLGKKVDFVNFIKVLSVINKRKDVFSSILNSDLGLKDSEMELIDKSILFYGIYELENKELPKEIAIDECIRLSRKFSSPDSYKFINAYLDKLSKLNISLDK
mgnify:CR=1 FL=1